MLEYLHYLQRAIGLALMLRPEVAEAVERYPESGRVVLGIVFLAGASMLLGQSVVLIVNRVRPLRFLLSVAVNGLLFIVSGAVWAVALWLAGRWLFAIEPSLGLTLRLVGLSFAPQVFGFLILVPYAGPFIQRVLYTWSLLIAVGAVQFSFKVGFFAGFVCVVLGWLLLWLLTISVGRPIMALHDRLVRRILGTPLDASIQDIVAALAKGERR
jgi:hypothetical protein